MGFWSVVFFLFFLQRTTLIWKLISVTFASGSEKYNPLISPDSMIFLSLIRIAKY